eukprot:5307341-Amphidinium_carterae.1
MAQDKPMNIHGIGRPGRSLDKMLRCYIVLFSSAISFCGTNLVGQNTSVTTRRPSHLAAGGNPAGIASTDYDDFANQDKRASRSNP